MDANTLMTSAGGALAGGRRGAGGGGVQARQPAIQAATPLAMSNPAPNPARPTPPEHTAARRSS